MDDFPESPTTSAPASPRVSHEDKADDATAGQKARWEQPGLRRLAMGEPADQAELNAENVERRS
jgi:hypothetical protein